MPARFIHKLLSAMFLLSQAQCSEDVCSYGTEQCPPLDVTLGQDSNTLSLSHDTKISFAVSSAGLNAPLVVSLTQGMQSMDLSSSCVNYQCSPTIAAMELKAKSFQPGAAQIVPSQPGRPLGTPGQVTITDPSFDFAAPAVTALPAITDTSTPHVATLIDVGVVGGQVAVSRVYQDSSGYYTTEIVLSAPASLSSATPATNMGAANASDYQVAFTGSHYFTAKKNNGQQNYTLSSCSAIGTCTSVGANVAFSAMTPPQMTSLQVSADEHMIYATGSDASVYGSAIPIGAPLGLLAATPYGSTTMGLFLVPLSSTSLAVLATSAMGFKLFTQAGTSWTPTSPDPPGNISITAMAAAPLAGTLPDLVVASGTKITFFKNSGNNTFTPAAAMLELPLSETDVITAMAVGDLDQQNGSDVAIITPNRLYIALHQ